MKVLIIQSAFIGDVILAVPLAETVKQSSPGSEVHFLTMPVYGDFLSKQPAISKALIDDKKGGNRRLFSFLKFCMRLRKEKYDIALIIHRSFRTGLLARIAGIKRRIGFDTAEGSIFYTEKVRYLRNMHEVKRNLLLGKTAGFEKWDGNWNLPSGRNPAVSAPRPGAAVITVSPFSNWGTKRWLPSYWAELINDLASLGRVVVVGSGKDVSFRDEIKNALRVDVLDFVGRTDFLELSALIKNSDVLVTGDSAPLHFASAFGVKTVVIFGPTVPEFGFGPYKQENIVIQKELPCRPCGIHGPRECPLGHHDCMRKILPGEVLAAVKKLLGLSG